MIKMFFLLLSLLPGWGGLSGIQAEVRVLDIQVPARVLDGGAFVDDLRAEDFVILEDGKPQDIRSLYLIRNGRPVQHEESAWSTLDTSRRFFMLFQCLDYNPQLTEAFDYFFQNVVGADDTLTVLTPRNNYNLTRQALRDRDPLDISQDLQDLIRRDIKIGAQEHNELMRDLKMIVRNISSSTGATSVLADMESSGLGVGEGLELQLPRYKDALQQLDELRMVNERRTLAFAEQLRAIPGQKMVFFFYQREFRPEIENRILSALVSRYQDQLHVVSSVEDLFSFYSRDNSLDMERVSRAFADSGAMFHFIFMHKEPESVRGIVMREQSEDVFNVFSQVAASTGGIVDSSKNPAIGFRFAAAACLNYYLLVYTHRGGDAVPGVFRSIDVSIKGHDYRVLHRAGYFER
jgi:hypothetical protein